MLTPLGLPLRPPFSSGPRPPSLQSFSPCVRRADHRGGAAAVRRQLRRGVEQRPASHQVLCGPGAGEWSSGAGQWCSGAGEWNSGSGSRAMVAGLVNILGPTVPHKPWALHSTCGVPTLIVSCLECHPLYCCTAAPPCCRPRRNGASRPQDLIAIHSVHSPLLQAPTAAPPTNVASSFSMI